MSGKSADLLDDIVMKFTDMLFLSSLSALCGADLAGWSRWMRSSARIVPRLPARPAGALVRILPTSRGPSFNGGGGCAVTAVFRASASLPVAMVYLYDV